MASSDRSTDASFATAAPNHLVGRVVVITGAASGFGRLVATRAARLGARVIAADINAAELDETVRVVRAAVSEGADGGDAAGSPGGEIEAKVADVTSRAEMNALVAFAEATFGGVDALLNNAGVMPLAFFSDHEVAADAWDRCIDINFKGVLNGIYAVHDVMIRQGRGQIVNVSSVYGNYPVAGAAVYGATKAAVNFISEALRQESLGKIKVTTIRPTGVPSTGLGAGVINPAAIGGVVRGGQDAFIEKLGKAFGENPPEAMISPDSIEYCALAPELLADQIVFALNQPWGVSIADLTVRASGDDYLI